MKRRRWQRGGRGRSEGLRLHRIRVQLGVQIASGGGEEGRQRSTGGTLKRVLWSESKFRMSLLLNPSERLRKTCETVGKACWGERSGEVEANPSKGFLVRSETV